MRGWGRSFGFSRFLSASLAALFVASILGLFNSILGLLVLKGDVPGFVHLSLEIKPRCLGGFRFSQSCVCVR